MHFLNTLHILIHLILTTHEVDNIIISVLQLRELRHKEVK